MIITRNLLAEELLTTFKVIKVHQEPNAESLWTLQFEDYPPITYFDKCFNTIEEDEQLGGKMIKAQIDLDITDGYDEITLITDPAEQKKSVTYISDGLFITTGIYFEDHREIEPRFDNDRISSCLDSLFKMSLTANLGSEKLGFKKGDWVRIKTSERVILIDRRYTPLPE